MIAQAVTSPSGAASLPRGSENSVGLGMLPVQECAPQPPGPAGKARAPAQLKRTHSEGEHASLVTNEHGAENT